MIIIPFILSTQDTKGNGLITRKLLVCSSFYFSCLTWLSVLHFRLLCLKLRDERKKKEKSFPGKFLMSLERNAKKESLNEINFKAPEHHWNWVESDFNTSAGKFIERKKNLGKGSFRKSNTIKTTSEVHKFSCIKCFCQYWSIMMRHKKSRCDWKPLEYAFLRSINNSLMQTIHAHWFEHLRRRQRRSCWRFYFGRQNSNKKFETICNVNLWNITQGM